jgi:hypothetical protein
MPFFVHETLQDELIYKGLVFSQFNRYILNGSNSKKLYSSTFNLFSMSFLCLNRGIPMAGSVGLAGCSRKKSTRNRLSSPSVSSPAENF